MVVKEKRIDVKIKSENKKPKLSFEEQVDYLKNVKGVKFGIISENEALEFLSYNNYLLKLKAYGKNYPKHTDGKYQNLEFAYLVELSTLDMFLREKIVKLTLNVEHYLKVQILRDITENDEVDGYDIVNEFLKMKPYLVDKLREKSENSYCKELINKRIEHLSAWDIVEMISLGDFIDFYEFYYAQYSSSTVNLANCLKPVQWLRNAAAHNNCIINNLNSSNRTINPNRKVSLYIGQNCSEISSKTREKKMSTKPIHDFIVTLYVFNMVVSSDKVKYYTMCELKELFDGRFIKHKDYFKDNPILLTNYKFVKIVIDHFYNLCNNM